MEGEVDLYQFIKKLVCGPYFYYDLELINKYIIINIMDLMARNWINFHLSFKNTEMSVYTYGN